MHRPTAVQDDGLLSPSAGAGPTVQVAAPVPVARPVPPSPRPPPPPAPAGRARQRGWGTPLAVLITGMFMAVLDNSIVNVAVPAIRGDFGVSVEDIQWINTAFTLTEGVTVPAAAWIGTRFGLKQTFIGSILLFTFASALCGLSGGLGQIIGARILQAVPGGLIPVTCLSILFRIVPPNKLGTAMGLYGLGVTVAPGVGPTLGGYLVEYANWRLCFYINVPIGIVGAIAAAALLPSFPAQRGRPLDVPGFLAAAGGLFALLLAFEEGPDWGWTGYRVLGLAAVGINLMALFVVIQLHARYPLLNLAVFRYRPMVISLLVRLVLSLAMFAVLFYIPNFLQSAQRLTPWHTGLVMLAPALVLMVLMPITGRLYDRFGARWLAAPGCLVAGTGLALLSRINIDIPREQVILAMTVMFAGVALAMMPTMSGGLSSLPPTLTDVGSAFNNLVMQVGASVGLAAMTVLTTVQRAQFMIDRSILTSPSGPSADPRVLAMQQDGVGGLIPLWQQLSTEVQAQTYSNAFLAAAALTTVGAVAALCLPRKRATTTTTTPAAH
jgi:EmrB/QacA subfamily drug resistance transporter